MLFLVVLSAITLVWCSVLKIAAIWPQFLHRINQVYVNKRVPADGLLPVYVFRHFTATLAKSGQRLENNPAALRPVIRNSLP